MQKKDHTTNVSLEIATKDELEIFKKDLQKAFSVAVNETFGQCDELIPPDEDIEKSFKAPGAIIYNILSNGTRVGGAVVLISDKTQHNSLDLFFISPDQHSHGIGKKAWQLIEKAHPETKVWETVTPYFEKRNIHFYVNKCGFHIVEFYNKYHLDTYFSEDEGLPGEEDFFRFEKVMN